MAGFFLLFIIASFLYPSPTIAGTDNSPLTTYIVQIKQPENMVFTSSEDRENWHKSFLPSTNGYDRMLYSYKNVISGFAARLTEEEVKALEKRDGFVSAQPDRLLRLHTTHTPSFLGLNQDTGFWKDSNFGKGVIIGILDSGITLDHPSFRDDGMPPPPAKWKGRCELSACNNKIIGARSFIGGSSVMLGRNDDQKIMSPIDIQGHGTHTASTAAGAFVPNANVLGNANGTAVGMAPLAHLAIYKVCVLANCTASDILKGMDSAVEDGVDVLSISLGGSDPRPFYNSPIDIGSFGVMERGIFVSCSAGNSGPSLGTISNGAPWVLSVGASTTDRSISAVVKLGNGDEFKGQSLFQPKDFPSTSMPLIYPGANGKPETATCGVGSLSGIDVRGKVVLCDFGGAIGPVAMGTVVKAAGGAAMILTNTDRQGFSTSADYHVLPASHLSFSDGLKIKAYINSTSTPTAMITFEGTILGTLPAPMVAFFSSRGPNRASLGILKPDIIGPGDNILAAWPTQLSRSTTSAGAAFNIISGTSMSCPHLSGIAALLKSSHPDWSPAAIKSAIMTTADVLDLEGKPIADEKHNPANLFATGAGHVNPSKASDPGLVYDILPDDYTRYLCGLNYTDSQVITIVGRPIQCSSLTRIREEELNYPSLSVILGPSRTFNRTVTNVGQAKSSYSVEIDKPQGVEVSVKPETLTFSEVNEKMTFSVTFSRSSAGGTTMKFVQGSLKWVSSPSKYVVRSPISVIFLD